VYCIITHTSRKKWKQTKKKEIEKEEEEEEEKEQEKKKKKKKKQEEEDGEKEEEQVINQSINPSLIQAHNYNTTLFTIIPESGRFSEIRPSPAPAKFIAGFAGYQCSCSRPTSTFS